MPAVTLRLRLSIAALTLAAALGGAFLVSSAPAQTQPKPTPAVTPEMLKFRAERQQDLANLKAIGLALVHYEADQPNYRLPDAKHWMDEISPYLKDKTVFFDPFQPNTRRYGYAFNSRCSGKSLAAFVSPSEAVAVFDSTSNARNASDTGQSLRTFAVGDALLADYLFEDGHAKMLRDPVQSRFIIQWDQRFVHMTPAHPSAGLPTRMHWRPADSNTNAEKVFGAAQQPDQEIGQARFLAGLTPVQGPGVVVTLRDSKRPFSYPKGGWPAGMPPPNIIHDSDINQAVNELKAAGAEAIAVKGQRLVATSFVRCAGPTVYVNNMPVSAPYVIKAIGDPKTLAAALNMPSGIAAQIAVYDRAMFTVQQAATLTLPAYAGKGEMHYAKPISAADVLVLPAPPSKVSVTLDSRGAYFLDGVQLPEAQIEQFLAARARQNPNITAVIKCDTNQFYSRVGQLVNVVKKAGIYSIQIAPQTSSTARRNALLSAMQVERDQLQLRQMIVGTQIEALNAQMKVQRQGFIQQNKQLKLRKLPAITASETRALLEVLQKEGKEKQILASALAAQNEVQKTANLPPNNPARIAAQQKFAPILAKLQFLVDVNKYDRQWVAMYKSGAEKINSDKRQIMGLLQQQRFLQAQLANINIQIAQESFATNR